MWAATQRQGGLGLKRVPAGLATGASQGPHEGSFRRIPGGVKRERDCPISKASRGGGAEEPSHVHLQERRPGQSSRSSA